jgi:chemotaxis protein CheD
MFCETGVPLLFKACYELGAKKGRIVIKIAGGAQVLKASEVFSIGQRNHGALRKILFRNNVLIEAEDIGGNKARTMRLNIGTGEVTSKHPGQGIKIL